MKDTGQEDVPENADLNEISEQREEISEADDANAKDDESNRVVVLQKGRKESIGINLIRASVRLRSGSELEDRPSTWPHPGSSSSTAPIPSLHYIQESPIPSIKSLGSSTARSSPSLISNSNFLNITRESPTPSNMSIAKDEEGMEHVIMKENSWDDFYPTEARNRFIKDLAEQILAEKEKYSKLKERIEQKLKVHTSLSCFKFDEAFIELFLQELSACSEEAILNPSSIHRLIQEYFGRKQFDFPSISGDFKIFVNSCLLFLVENSQCQTMCLRKFLNWFFFKLMHYFDFIKKEWKDTWKNEMKEPFDDKIEVYLNEALVQACKLGKHELVFEFLNKGFKIYDKDFKETKQSKLLLENQYNQRHLELFRATSTSSYLLANFCYKYKKYKNGNDGKPPRFFSDIDGEDVFSLTLYNMMIAKNLTVNEYDLSEYTKQLQKTVDEGRDFVGDLVSQCANLKEAKLLLSQDSKLDQYELKNETTEWEYRRLDEACLSQHKDLVTHDFSQRIFRETWHKSDNLKNPVQFIGIMVKLIQTLIFTQFYVPIHLLVYMPMNKFGDIENLKARLKSYPILDDLVFHYTIPRNRCYSDIVSHLQMIVLILFVMINPNDEPKVLDIDWYDICLSAWAFGSLMKCFREVFYFLKYIIYDDSKNKLNHGMRYINSLKDNFLQITNYKVMQLLCCCLILLGKLFKLIGFKDCTNPSQPEMTSNQTAYQSSILLYSCEQDDPLKHCDNSFLKTAYALIGIGATLCILNLLHWFELNSYLGPIMISLRQTIGDILKILTTFVVFLFAFSVGLHFSLRLSNMYCQGEHDKIVWRNATDYIESCKEERVETNMTGFNLEDNVNHFRLFKEAMKTCFWSLFDPGHPEVIGCTQGPPRHLGMFLWASYQIGNAVIVMNLLIALMNATISSIQEDKVNQWLYARTQIWRQYFDHHKMACLPVPYNLLEMMMNLFLMLVSFCVKKKSSNISNISLEEVGSGESGKEKEYLDLISKICERYIQMKKRRKEEK